LKTVHPSPPDVLKSKLRPGFTLLLCLGIPAGTEQYRTSVHRNAASQPEVVITMAVRFQDLIQASERIIVVLVQFQIYDVAESIIERISRL
jgi:hypothetical protein